MNKTLHIVSGTTVINVMQQTKLTGDFLAWQDFLHEGPIPKKFSLQQLSKIRAYFLSENKYTTLNNALKTFEKRNTTLENHHDYKEVILWFEQDLYDQLQLLQILNWFEANLSKHTKVKLSLTDKYFAEYSFQELQEASRQTTFVTQKHFQLAKKAWNALSESTPLSWFKLLDEQTSELPFLKNTVIRLLEEYPNTINGLSRTEHQALLSISNAEATDKLTIFNESQKQEQQPFLADIIFWKILKSFEEHKLVVKNDGINLSITELGKDILIGKNNWLTIKNPNHWIGGVNLKENLWCWDIKKRTIGHYYYSASLDALLSVKAKRSK